MKAKGLHLRRLNNVKKKLQGNRKEQAVLPQPRVPPPVEPLHAVHVRSADETEDDNFATALQKSSRVSLLQEAQCEQALNFDEFFWTQLCQLPHPSTDSSARSSNDTSSIFSEFSYTSNLSEIIVETNVNNNADSAVEGILEPEDSSCRPPLEGAFLLGMGSNELYAGINSDDWFLGEPSFSKLFEDLDLDSTEESREADLSVDRLVVEDNKACVSYEADARISSHEANFKVHTPPAKSLPSLSSQEVVSHTKLAKAGNTSLPTTPDARRWNLEYQEYQKKQSSLMDLLGNMPVEIKDSSGRSHVHFATLDTGSGISFVNGHFCSRHGLWRRPISPEHLKIFSTVGGSFVPTHHVSVPLRISSIGLDSFSTVMLLIANLPPSTNIVLGRDFLGKHKILQFSSAIKAGLPLWKGRNCFPNPATRSVRNVLVIEAKESTVPTDENTIYGSSSGLAIASQFRSPVQSDASPAERLTASPSDDLSDLNSESSLSGEASEGSYSDIDPHDTTTERLDFGLYSDGCGNSDNHENLERLLVPMMQGIVKTFVKEYQDIYLQDWVDGTRQCSPQSESTTTSQTQTTNLSTSGVLTSVAGKRVHGSDDEGNQDGDNGGPPKRHKGNPPGPPPTESVNHNFACPYRKLNARKYCATSRQWKFCATTSFENVARLKAHLYKYHKIHQCTRCWQNFPSAEALKAHVDAIEECQRCLSKEAEGVQGVNAEMERRLRSRKKTEDAWSQKDRWIKIFTMLFGNIPLPDPYFEQPIIEEIDPTNAALSPDSRQLSDIESFLRAELPQVIENVLQQVAQHGINLIENRLRLLLPDVIRDSQDQVFSHYRSRLTSGQDAPLPHAQIAAPIVDAIISHSNISTQSTHEQDFTSQYSSRCEQLTNLGDFYNQPPFQMLPSSLDYNTALAARDTAFMNFEQSSIGDSGYQTDSVDTTQYLGEIIEGVNAPNTDESDLIKQNTSQDRDFRNQTPHRFSISASGSTPPLPAATVETLDTASTADASPTPDQINQILEDTETRALFEEFTYGSATAIQLG